MSAHCSSGDRSKREYIRHPIDIPIHIETQGPKDPESVRLNNVSVGGLSIRTPNYVEPGVSIKISIGVVQPPFEVRVLVQWCHCVDDEFELGVKFTDVEDAFRVRMVEQVCHIEHYRQRVWREEKRLLSGETAAAEWIEQFAHEFPKLGVPPEYDD